MSDDVTFLGECERNADIHRIFSNSHPIHEPGWWSRVRILVKWDGRIFEITKNDEIKSDLVIITISL